MAGRAGSGPGPPVPSWPAPCPPVWFGSGPAGWWGEGGHIYPAIRRLYRARKTPPARLAWLRPGPAGVSCNAVFIHRHNRPPAAAPGLGPALGLAGVCRAGPALVQVEQAGRVRLSWSGVAPGPCSRRRSWSRVGPALLARRGPLVRVRRRPRRSGPGGSGSWSGAALGHGPAPGPARPFPKATAIFPPPTPGRKFPAIFPARYFMRAV